MREGEIITRLVKNDREHLTYPQNCTKHKSTKRSHEFKIFIGNFKT